MVPQLSQIPENAPETHAAASGKRQESLGVSSPHNVALRLWEKAADKLTDQELNWVADLSTAAQMELANMVEVTESIGCLVLADEDSGALQDKYSVSTLLFSISKQLDSINAMLNLSSNAKSMLDDPDIYRRASEVGGE
jgi:hypothetical protein